MKILISIIPGGSFACAVFLFFISFGQFHIFKKRGYLRSKYISLFCFFAAFFALEQSVAQSRVFSPEATHLYVLFSTMCFSLSLFFYVKSLSFFLAIPDFLFKLYKVTLFSCALAAFIAIPAFFLDIYLCFDPSAPLRTGNYFVDSYSTRFGTPLTYINTLLSFTGGATVVMATVLLRLVLRSSRDIFFIVGLLFSIIAATMENFLLPFTFAYFVPMIFVSNLFEAFRMNVLSGREYRKEENEEQEDTVPVNNEMERYQNSNLSGDRIKELASKITSLLKNEEIYINPNLNSDDLAKKVGIPAYQLSQVVNIGLNTTFFELLSTYRIEHVKKKLKDRSLSDETIINIAYSSGFNSKSAFNTAFKKQTGMTPSHYRKQN